MIRVVFTLITFFSSLSFSDEVKFFDLTVFETRASQSTNCEIPVKRACARVKDVISYKEIRDKDAFSRRDAQAYFLTEEETKVSIFFGLNEDEDAPIHEIRKMEKDDEVCFSASMCLEKKGIYFFRENHFNLYNVYVRDFK